LILAESSIFQMMPTYSAAILGACPTWDANTIWRLEVGYTQPLRRKTGRHIPVFLAMLDIWSKAFGKFGRMAPHGSLSILAGLF
jgi:hypothetical protein